MKSAPNSQTSLDKQTDSDASLKERQNDVPAAIAEEAVGGDKQEHNDQQDETLVERLHLLNESNPYRDLDERAHTVRETIKAKYANAPKTELDELEENKPEMDKRLEKSEKALTDLLTFGNEIISNIKVACEKRELLRREFETNQLIDLDTCISKGATEATAQYNDIVARWSELGAYKEPLILFEKMQAQQENIVELLRGKDEMLAKCQAEIDRINASFEGQLLQQQADICSMAQRVNAQIDLMKNAYIHHLSLLENTLDDERQTIALKEQEKWKQFYDIAHEHERFKLEMTREKKDFYTQEIQRIMRQQEEITRATRIRLEKESEMLLYDLRCTKNQMLTNSEKLDYNYQVLQKRNEENVIINNQQKRRVGKLTEALASTKKRIKAMEKSSENTIIKLTSDIQKLHDSITELEKKDEHFAIHNRKKFVQIWDVNYQEVKTLIERVFEIDRILHEQQLGLPWQKPDLSLEEFELVRKERTLLYGDTQSHQKSETSSINSETQRQQIAKENSANPLPIKQEWVFRRSQKEALLRKAVERKSQEKRIEKRLLRNILRKVSIRGGFLVEDRLLAFLEPYTEERKTFVRIDNIFAALRIHDMAAVNKLVEFFRPYAWCPNCMAGIPREQLKKLYHPCQLKSTGDEDDMFSPSSTSDSIEESIGNNKMAASSKIKLASQSQPSIAVVETTGEPCKDHYLIVESAMVLTALSEFTNHQSKVFEEETKRHTTLPASKVISEDSSKKTKQNPSLIDINDAAVCEYWRKFLNYMPEEKLKLWQSLEHGLHHYLDVLKQRDQLDKDCAALRQQNLELKHLLQKFNV